MNIYAIIKNYYDFAENWETYLYFFFDKEKANDKCAELQLEFESDEQTDFCIRAFPIQDAESFMDKLMDGYNAFNKP